MWLIYSRSLSSAVCLFDISSEWNEMKSNRNENEKQTKLVYDQQSSSTIQHWPIERVRVIVVMLYCMFIYVSFIRWYRMWCARLVPRAMERVMDININTPIRDLAKVATCHPTFQLGDWAVDVTYQSRKTKSRRKISMWYRFTQFLVSLPTFNRCVVKKSRLSRTYGKK